VNFVLILSVVNVLKFKILKIDTFRRLAVPPASDKVPKREKRRYISSDRGVSVANVGNCPIDWCDFSLPSLLPYGAFAGWKLSRAPSDELGNSWSDGIGHRPTYSVGLDNPQTRCPNNDYASLPLKI
jgi:hypothetical protein